MKQGREPDPRPFTIYRNRRGSPRWYQRWIEAWWVVTGKWSLHRAWQAGKDLGGMHEWQRIIINGGDLGPVFDSAIYVTSADALNGAEPAAEKLRELRRKAWEHFRKWRIVPVAAAQGSEL